MPENNLSKRCLSSSSTAPIVSPTLAVAHPEIPINPIQFDEVKSNLIKNKGKQRERTVSNDSRLIGSEDQNSRNDPILPVLSDLSWGKWWPFEVLEPEPDTAGIRLERSETRNFLELFTGIGRNGDSIGREDRQMHDRNGRNPKLTLEEENELLNTNLEDLSLATSTALISTSSNSAIRNSSPSRQYLLAAMGHYQTVPIPNHHRHFSTIKKHAIDPLLEEADEADAGEDVYSKIRDSYRAPRFPIVFCHGLFGFDTLGPASIKALQLNYWIGVKEALEEMGAAVLIGSVPMSASIEERANILCSQIEQNFPGREVNLIGHSMGGLDCRYLLSSLKPTTFKVTSLVTIATPHLGSSYADFLLDEVLGKKIVPALLKTLDAVGIPGGGRAFEDLTTHQMKIFNENNPDVEGVKYYSYGASFNPSYFSSFRMSWSLLMEREGENDGMVSVKASKWGEYLGTLKDVNHMELVGWNRMKTGWSLLLGKKVSYKPISFYCSIAEKLADEGF